MSNIHMNAVKGEVVLTFDVSYSWLSFTPDQAREFSKKLNDQANEAEAQVKAREKSE